MITHLMMGLPNLNRSVSLPGANLNALNLYPGMAKTQYYLSSDGTADSIITDGFGTNTAALPDWFSAAPQAGIGADYHVRFTVTSVSPGDLGAIGGSPLNTWNSLASDQVVTMSTTDGNKRCTILVEISDNAGASVLDTAIVAMNVDSDH